MLQFSDRLQLRNRSGRTVTIVGYEGEPYARVLANGTVEVNKRSPAYFLNQSFYGNVTVPASASPRAAPAWTVVDRTGQFEWHDHRIHWMSPVLPPQVKDKGKRTLIFDWHVPIAVGARRGTSPGSCTGRREASSAPVAAIVVGVAIVVLGLALVLVTSAGAEGAHRRRPAAAGGGPAGSEPRPVTERRGSVCRDDGARMPDPLVHVAAVRRARSGRRRLGLVERAAHVALASRRRRRWPAGGAGRRRSLRLGVRPSDQRRRALGVSSPVFRST